MQEKKVIIFLIILALLLIFELIICDKQFNNYITKQNIRMLKNSFKYANY